MKKSFEEIRAALYKAIEALMTAKSSGGSTCPCWIENVYEDEIIYNMDGELFKAPYKFEGDDAVLGEGVKVEKTVSYKPVFSVDRLFTLFKESRPDGTVVRTGKVFEAGDYPDKKVAFDEGDLEAMVRDFSPVDNDLEHASTILDGKLGGIQKVWNVGKELFADIALPKWLDDAIGPDPIKVSLAFNRNKRIVGNALVLRPRIADAAIMSAFSLSQSSGKPVQPNKKTMNLKTALASFFGITDPTNLDQEVTLPASLAEPIPPTKKSEFSETDPAVMARFKAFEDQISAMTLANLKDKAYAFADEIIRSKKALPAQRDVIATMFSNAVKGDAGQGPVFSAETGFVQGDQVEALKSLFSTAPTHAFTGEAIPDGSALLFAKTGDSYTMDEEKKVKLLAASGLGQAALKKAKGDSKA